MAVTVVKTQLSLDEFARYSGIHPLHFNQVILPEVPSRMCGDVLVQYAWQTADKTGRDEIANAIASAEDLITSQLGYDLLPRWNDDEQVAIPVPRVPEYIRAHNYNFRGFPLSVRTEYGYVHSGGKEAWTLVASGAPIVYNDFDGDGYSETGSVSVNTTVTDAEEIALVYPGRETQYEIKPLQSVVINPIPGVVVIQFRREQAVITSQLEAMNPVGVDGMDDAMFLATIDVYRHWNDPSQQVNFVYENICHCDVSPCEHTLGTGCLQVRESRNGIVGVSQGVWNTTTQAYDFAISSECRGADRLRLWYRAGWKASNSRPWITMDARWARAVTYLTLALLDRPLCQCDTLQTFTAHWSEDIGASKSSPSGASSYQIGRLRDNPIGTTRAAIYAWRLILQNKLGEGV